MWLGINKTIMNEKTNVSFELTIDDVSKKKPNDFGDNSTIRIYSPKYRKLKYIIFLKKSSGLPCYTRSIVVDGSTFQELWFVDSELRVRPRFIDEFLQR